MPRNPLCRVRAWLAILASERQRARVRLTESCSPRAIGFASEGPHDLSLRGLEFFWPTRQMVRHTERQYFIINMIYPGICLSRITAKGIGVFDMFWVLGRIYLEVSLYGDTPIGYFYNEGIIDEYCPGLPAFLIIEWLLYAVTFVCNLNPVAPESLCLLS